MDRLSSPQPVGVQGQLAESAAEIAKARPKLIKILGKFGGGASYFNTDERVSSFLHKMGQNGIRLSETRKVQSLFGKHERRAAGVNAKGNQDGVEPPARRVQKPLSTRVAQVPLAASAEGSAATLPGDEALRTGADVNLPDRSERTPLMIAACEKNVDLASHLLNQGAGQSLTKILGETPLFLPVLCGQTDANQFEIMINHFGAKHAKQPGEGNDSRDQAKVRAAAAKDLMRENVRLLDAANAHREKSAEVAWFADAASAYFNQTLETVGTILNAHELAEFIDPLIAIHFNLAQTLIPLVMRKMPEALIEKWREDSESGVITRSSPAWSDFDGLQSECRLYTEQARESGRREQYGEKAMNFAKTLEQAAAPLCGPLDVEPLLQYFVSHDRRLLTDPNLPRRSNLTDLLHQAPGKWEKTFAKKFAYWGRLDLRKHHIERLAALLSFMSSNSLIMKSHETKEAAKACVCRLTDILVQNYVAYARQHYFVDDPERSTLTKLLEGAPEKWMPHLENQNASDAPQEVNAACLAELLNFISSNLFLMNNPVTSVRREAPETLAQRLETLCRSLTSA